MRQIFRNAAVTARRLWPGVWPRLVVLALAAAVLLPVGVAMRPYVRVGPPHAYDPPPSAAPPYAAFLTKRHPGTSKLDGWVINNSEAPCAEVVVWISSVNGLGHVFAGAVQARDWTYWSGEVRDANAKPMLIADRLHLSAGCYEANPGHRAPLRSS